MISILISFFIITSFNNCQNPNLGEPFLRGEVENQAGIHVFLEKVTPEKITLIDSAVATESGTFSFYKKPDEYGYFRVRFGGTGSTGHFAPYPSLIFLITNPSEKIYLKTRGPEYAKNCTISGSPQSEVLLEMLRRKTAHERLTDSLRTALNTNTYAVDFPARARTADSMYTQSEKNLKTFIKKKIEENMDNLVALEGLGFLKLEEELLLFQKVTENLKRKYPNNGYVRTLAANVEIKARTAIGAEAPDIKQPDPSGKIQSLHNLRGRYVLVDFWASWCRPCRMENPTLVQAYQKFKDKGFQIFQVSLDKDKNAWVNAIQQDGLGQWIHISDLKMWDSEPAKLYNVTGIPKSFLLDPAGKIIAVDLRGPALEQKLYEIFK